MPPSVHEGLVDVLYYCQHLTATNHSDRDTPINWTHANFSLYSHVIFIGDDGDALLTASALTTAASFLD